MCPVRSPRIGLISPYGSNLGDATIQEAVIQNILRRIPTARLYGIYFLPAVAGARHQIPAVPVASSSFPPHTRQRYCPRRGISNQPVNDHSSVLVSVSSPGSFSSLTTSLKTLLKKIPLVGSLVRRVYQAIALVASEASHIVESQKELRRTDLLIVAGGGQLCDYGNGPWGHPYNLFKWALLARLNGIPFWFLNVGSAPTTSSLSRFFFRFALRQANYRSHRASRSKAYLTELFGFLSNDPVLPDLAFSYQVPIQNEALGSGGMARPGKVVGIGPIAYCHPDLWPIKDKSVYDRYVTELARFAKFLLENNYRIVFFLTATTTDKRVVSDVRERIGIPSNVGMEEPFTETLESFFNTLSRVDLVVASRLHGVILSHVLEKPVLAIAFEEKVNSHMEETNQTRYCLDIRTFTASSAIDSFLDLERKGPAVRTQLKQTKETFARLLQQQYDRLAHRL
jgi:polysaccharide pyruvyl transferase WcaK-like protein